MQYKVIVVKESLLTGILLGGRGALPTKKLEEALNQYAKDGWKLSFIITDKRFFRSSAIVVLERE